MTNQRNPAARQGRAFTLVELLVVIGIIALLLAILLPTLSKARRSAVVLTSPIVYTGIDSAVHLTDASGRSDLVLEKFAKSGCPVCHSPPTWSPLGTTIGLTKPSKTNPSNYESGVLEPVSGQTRIWTGSRDNFIGWLDSERFLKASGPWAPAIVTVDTGAQQVIDNRPFQFEFIAPAPPQSPGLFIGLMYVTDSAGRADVVSYFRKDLSPGKTVWREPRGGGGGGTVQSQVSPRVDPQGEFVGWTIFRKGRPYIAIKASSDHSSMPPTLVGDQYAQAYFCDWTEGGDVLANVREGMGNWRLVILKRDGTLASELGTSIPPAEGVVASWRKYEHR